QKLKERIKEQIASDKKAKLYNDTLKEKFIENLLEAFAFDLPENIIEQEMDMLFRSEVDSMERAELEALQGKREEIKERREKHKEKAQRNVKLTLIIDALARANKLGISEQELFMRLYNEAMFLRQDPKTLLDYYQQSGYLPALQMALLEDKVLTFLLEKSIDKE
ncbi:MAG: trigger factor, partial [Helicobacter sp.]|nr:trigger factor [Helicobacter sp.]